MKNTYVEVIEKLKKHLEIEEKSIREYSKVIPRLKSRVLRDVLRSILIDSIAHREILRAIIKVLGRVGKEKFITELEEIPKNYKDITKIVKALKEHVEIEERAVKEMLSVAEQVEIYSIRETLRTLFEDEIRHHMVLKNIIKVFEEYSRERK